MNQPDQRPDEPIFVFGSPRSGTSLLSRLLNAHSRIGIPLESLLYDTFWPIRQHYGDLERPGGTERLLRHMLRWMPMRAWSPVVTYEHALANLDRRDFHGAFKAIVSAWADSQNKPVWGEKSPWHAFYWREILEGFPNARVVHIIRDPRDASLSWKKARQGPRNVYALAKRWAQYQAVMDEVRAGWPSDAFHEIRYEGLLQDPAIVCKDLCEFLREPFEQSMLAFHQSNERYNTDSTNRENLTRPVIADNFGKWQSELSEDEIRWIEYAAGERMDQYGYQRHFETAAIAAQEMARIRIISNPLSRIFGMIKDSQGQREAIQKKLFPVAARLRLM